MPDERPMKHRQECSSYEHDKKRKKHKRHKHSYEVEFEILKNNSKRPKPSEVIEIHGSSSEEGELVSENVSCDEMNVSKTNHKHRHKHSRHHSKKHKRSHNYDERDSNNDIDANKYSRFDDKGKSSRKYDSGLSHEAESNKRERDRNELTQEPSSDDNKRDKKISSKIGKERLPCRIKEEPSFECTDNPENRDFRRTAEEGKNRKRSDDKHDQQSTGIKREDGSSRRHPSRSGQNGGHRSRDDNEEYEWGSGKNSQPNVKEEPADKAKPDFKLSGKLTEDRNTYNGVVIKYSEPPEARMPKKRWRLYQFKGNETLPTLYIHRQSAYLIGRDRKVVDLPIDHPSCSKQHAALQYRLVTFERPNGTTGKQIRLYVIDLESANGTFINGSKIESKKYVELMEKDVVKFGFSSREYVLLHEQSKDDELSDPD